jgi:hypothetical protein
VENRALAPVGIGFFTGCPTGAKHPMLKALPHVAAAERPGERTRTGAKRSAVAGNRKTLSRQNPTTGAIFYIYLVRGFFTGCSTGAKHLVLKAQLQTGAKGAPRGGCRTPG